MRTLLAVVLFVPSIAFAQPEPEVAPSLYGTGNLRVEMACADGDVTPDQGLAVSVDGRPINALRINGEFGTAYDNDNNPYTTWSQTDVGYLVQPGERHITVTAPGCATDQADVFVAANHAEVISGRLEISDPGLMGTTGAPNGPGITFSATSSIGPHGPTSHTMLDTTSYTYDPAQTSYGGSLSLSVEHRNFVLAFDTTFDTGPVSGTASSPGSHFGPPAFSFSGSTYRLAQALRLGKRFAFHDVALAGGVGLGVAGWITSTTSAAGGGDAPGNSDGPDGTWYVPLWLGATVKPTCNWGLQARAEYDLHPTASEANGTAFALGVIYQPSDACSESPSLHVSPNI